MREGHPRSAAEGEAEARKLRQWSPLPLKGPGGPARSYEEWVHNLALPELPPPTFPPEPRFVGGTLAADEEKTKREAGYVRQETAAASGATEADEDGISYMEDGTALVPRHLLGLVPGLQPAAEAATKETEDHEMDDAEAEDEEEDGSTDKRKGIEGLQLRVAHLRKAPAVNPGVPLASIFSPACVFQVQEPRVRKRAPKSPNEPQHRKSDIQHLKVNYNHNIVSGDKAWHASKIDGF